MKRGRILLASLLVTMAAIQSAGAVTLGPVKQISGSGNNSFRPRLDQEGTRVAAVYERWLQGTQASSKVYIAISNDSGQTWGPAKKIYGFGGEQHNPDVAVCGQNLFVVYALAVGVESQYQVQVSTDGGVTFGPPDTKGLGRETAEILKDKARVVCSGGRFWWGYANGDVYLKSSMDYGVTYDIDKQLELDELIIGEISLANDGPKNVYMAWQTDDMVNTPQGEILFTRSTDGGKTWSSETTLTFRPGDGKHPTITELDAYGFRVVVSYVAGVGDPNEVRVMVSADRGKNFGTGKKLATGKHASIAVTKGKRIDLVWTDGTNLNHRSSKSDGQVWTPGTVVATKNQPGAQGTGITNVQANWVAGWSQFKNNRHRIYVRAATP